MSSQLESLKSFQDLQHLRGAHGALMDPMWNDYNKLLVNFEKLFTKIMRYLHEKVAYILLRAQALVL